MLFLNHPSSNVWQKRQWKNLALPYVLAIFLAIMSMDNLESSTHLPNKPSKGLKERVFIKPDPLDKLETAEDLIVSVKWRIKEYFSSDEYRKKLQNEIKIARYESKDLDLSNFQEKTATIALTESDYEKINTIVLERLQRLEKLEIIPVRQIAFYENNQFVPDLEGGSYGFYYDKDILGWKHYLWIKKNKWEKKFSFPEFGKVYVLDLLSLWEGFGSIEERKKKMSLTIFHECGGHGVMDEDVVRQAGADRVLNMMTSKWKKDPIYSEYLWDKWELHSRLLEYRETLFLLGKIQTINDAITTEHIAQLIQFYQKIGDDITVLFLKKYKPSEVTNVMNVIASNKVDSSAHSTIS